MKNIISTFCLFTLCLLSFGEVKAATGLNETTPNTESSALSVSFPNTAINVCIGQTTNIPVTIDGGTGPYTYAWTLNGTLSTQTGATFNYTGSSTLPQSTSLSVLVTDTSNGMTGTAGTNLLNVTSLSLVDVTDRTICDGVTVFIGSIANAPGTSYVWQVNGVITSTTPDFSYESDGMGVANVTVTATGAPGCSAMDSFVWTEVVNPEVSIGTTTSVCEPGTMVTMDATPSNASAGDTYSYTWNTTPPATTASISPTITDTSFVYEVTVTNTATTCSSFAARWITYNNIQVSETHTDVTCFGQNDGAIDLTATQLALSPLSYSWQNVTTGSSLNSTQDQTGLAPGSYQVTVQDGSCNRSLPNPVVITQPSAALAVTGNTTNPGAGQTNGAINITATGGTPPYTYAWSNGATTEDLNGLAAGTYTVTVTDSRNCTANNSFTLSAPAALTIAVTSQTNILCNGQSTGAINITAAGGTPPYTYAWSNGATTEDLTGLAAGSYTVTVTDAASATANQTVNLTQATAIAISQQSITPASGGNANGAIDINVAGGTPPYTYAWQNSGGTAAGTTQDITGLAAGNYSITVTDANSCTATQSFTVPAANIVLTLDGSTNPNCAGASTGAVNITASSGTAPYTYVWSNGVTTEDLSGVPAGSYNVTVSDAGGLTASLPNAVVLTDPAAIMLAPSVTNVTCNGASTGSVSLTITNGTAPYTYAWSNGATSAQLSNVAAGMYSVTVTDAGSCTGTAANITVSEPTTIQLSGAVTNVTIAGQSTGAVDLTVSGGTPAYTYAWSNGTTTEDLSGVSAGMYTVTVTDANSCTKTETFTITQPDPLSIVITSQTNVTCNGGNNGAANITVNGGTAPFTYAWSTGATTEDISNLTAGTYTLTVTDTPGSMQTQTVVITEPTAINDNETQSNISCAGGNNGSIQLAPTGGTAPYTYVWSNGETSSGITNLVAGTYSATVTDANMCTFTASYTLTQPTALVVTGTQTNVLIAGQSTGVIDLMVSGGTPAYSYAWSNGTTAEDLSNIPAGMYSVTVTDANSCTQTANFNITQSDPLLVTLTGQSNVVCNGGTDGTADMSVSGGIPPYTYAWSTGATTEDLTGLSAGTYTLTVTDSPGAMQTQTVVITQPTALNDNETVNNISCFGQTDGSIQLAPSGGTGPYTYAWSSGQSTASLSNLSQGTYTATITDANLCTFTASYSIVEPQALNAFGIETNVTVSGGNDGSIDLTVIGGTAPYSFVWSNDATTEDISGLPAGSYAVLVTDANGCTTVKLFTINQPGPIELVFEDMSNISCNGQTDGFINIGVFGGSPPYSYAWSNGATTQDLTGLGAGDYQVTVTDNAGVTASLPEPITIGEPSPLTNTGSVNNVSCNGVNDGSIVLNINGGTSPYSFNWAGGQTGATLSGLSAGNYAVTITDANMCSLPLSFTVEESSGIAITETITQVSCAGGQDGQISVEVNGGTAPYTYAWSDGIQTQNRTNLSAATYTLTVSDSAGCSSSETYMLNNPAAITASEMLTQPTCAGNSDGQIVLSAQGGTGNLSFAWSHDTMLTGNTATGLFAGTYNVSITDQNNCTQSFSYTLTDPAQATLTVATQNTACDASSGSATGTLTGATGTITYRIADEAGTELAVQTGNAQFTGLAAGNYQMVAVTESNCSSNLVAFTIEPPVALAGTSSASNETCVGNDGTATLAISSGSGSYTYNWNTSNPSVQNQTGLSAGTYSVTITDTNTQCTLVLSATVGTAEAISITNTQTQNPTCFGEATGSVTLTHSGTGNFTYTWASTDGSFNTTTSVPSLQNLAAGNYSVTVSQGTCQANTTFSLTSNQAVVITQTALNNPTCGASNGNISVEASGGSGTGYTYAWSAGMPNNQSLVSGLAAGEYTLTVTDSNNCTATQTFTLTAPGAPTGTASSTNITCFGANDGTITVNATGGTGTLTYALNGGTAQSSNQFTGLSAATYTVTITDQTACVFTVSNISVTGPTAALAATENITQVSTTGGNDGAISLEVTGGTAPYQYNWSNGTTGTAQITGLTAGSYSVTVTDVNNCTINPTYEVTTATGGMISLNAAPGSVSCNGGSDGELTVQINGGTEPYTILWTYPNGTTHSTITINNLSAGTYQVSVSDANGVSQTLNSVVVSEPVALAGMVSVGNACGSTSQGTLTFAVTGGTLPYTYSYTFNGSTQTQSDNDPEPDEITGLMPGLYENIMVTDDKGCTFSLPNQTIGSTGSVSITDLNVSNVTCNGGMDGFATVSVSAAGIASTVWTNAGGTVVSNELALQSAAAGTYTLTVTDNAGCSATETAMIGQPEPIAVTSTVNGVACFGETNGSITLGNFTGGNGNYTWTWADGFANISERTNLAGGAYALTVTDGSGCTQNLSFTVNAPSAALSASAVSTAVTCNGNSDGTATVTPAGGTSPYTYAWSNGTSGMNMLSNLTAGNYTVTVTDANNCTTQTSVEVTQPAALMVASSLTNISCNGGNNGAIDLTVSGGDGNYQFAWEGGINTEDRSNLTAGTYNVTISYNFSGGTYLCQTTQSVTLTEPDAISLTPALTNVACNGGSTGAITTTLSGGTGAYTYAWSNDSTSTNITGLTAGVYSLTVTDANNCTATFNNTLTEPEALTLSGQAQSAGCSNPNDGSVDVTSGGGTSSYTYVWSNNTTNEDLTGAAAGEYTVTLTDANSCTLTQSYTVQATDTTFTPRFVAASGLFNVDSVQVNSNDIIQFRDLTLPSPTSWLWNFGDGNTSTEQHPQHSYPNNPAEGETNYIAKLTVSNGVCTDSLQKSLFITNNMRPTAPGEDDFSYLQFAEVRAFPNPSLDFVNLIVEMNREEDAEVLLTDISGRHLHKEQLTGDDRYELTLDVNHLTHGVYFIRVKALTRIHTLKLVIGL